MSLPLALKGFLKGHQRVEPEKYEDSHYTVYYFVEM